MPACSSSRIPALVGRVGAVSLRPDRGSDVVETAAGLAVALGTVPDPRRRRGVRHRMVSVLSVAVCAVLAGARSFTAIAEWAADLPPVVRRELGVGRSIPSESAIRRLLRTVDPDALDQALSGWLQERSRAAAVAAAPSAAGSSAAAPSAAGSVRVAAAPGRAVIAVDGKSARGARGARGSSHAPTGRVRPGQWRGAGSVRGRGQDQREHRVRPAARPPRTGERGGHRARAAHPPRPCRVPPCSRGALRADGEGQPAAATRPARRAALGRGAHRGPRPRQGPRPRRDPDPQDHRGGRGDRVPARLPDPADHPPSPGAAREAPVEHRDRLRRHRPRLEPGQRPGPRRHRARALGYREPAALDPRRGPHRRTSPRSAPAMARR